MKKYTVLLVFILILTASLLLVACDNEDEKYIVTFDYGYELKVETREVVEGSIVTPLVPPARTGYRFLYWASGDKEFDFANTPVTKNTSLYAVWQRLKNVKVVVGDTTSTFYLEEKDSYTAEDISVSMENADFVGYYKLEGGEPVYVDIANGLADKTTLYADFATTGMTFENISETEVRVKEYKGDAKNIIMPTFYEGKKVTEIGEIAFATITDIDKLTLPRCLKTISNGGLSGIIIDKVNIPKTVETIGDNAFASAKIGTLNFSSESMLKSIGANAFGNVQWLTSVRLPDGLETIHERAFANCNDLTKIYIPNTVTTLDAYIFEQSNAMRIIFHTPAEEFIKKSINWDRMNRDTNEKHYVKVVDDDSTFHRS